MKDPLVVIGIVGHARAGKDTVAKILGAHHGFHRVALADIVRMAFGSLDGPTWELHKDFSADFLPRRSLQLLGTEARDEVGSETLWCDVILAMIRYADRLHPRRINRFVIPDIRYPHEAVRLKAVVQSWGGTFEAWRVRRNTPKIAESNHSSELFIDKVPVNADLCNDGTIGYLAHQVDHLIASALAAR